VTSLFYALGVLSFVVAILVSIGLHELGHMIPAKAFGGKVTQYFIGFGPTVWSWKRGETEYGVKAIPLGGYVKIVGMLPPGAEQLADEVLYDDEGNRVTKIRKSNTGMFTQLISDARAAEWELIGPEDEHRLFYKMAWWKKVVVMAGGPSVNIAIAFFLFWAVFGTYGNPSERVPTDGAPVVASVNKCVIPAAEERTTCQDDDLPAPAYEAGLRPGDTITTFNGTAITGYDQLQALIRDNRDGAAEIGYVRDGEQLTTTTHTLVQERPVDDDNPDKLTAVGFLGVAPTTRLQTGGPIYTTVQMGYTAEQTVEAVIHLPDRVWGVARAIVGLQERDVDSPVSIVGGGRIAGETASVDWLPTDAKITLLLLLIAGFNFFIGAFNFIPLLPLDGGHIASALWEAVRRGLAKLRGRPDPGHVDAAKLLPIAYVVAVGMLAMSLVLIVGDFVVPLHIDGS
jgi:membrane-associated protease RseP (regulator of RpoE activity)